MFYDEMCARLKSETEQIIWWCFHCSSTYFDAGQGVVFAERAVLWPPLRFVLRGRMEPAALSRVLPTKHLRILRNEAIWIESFQYSIPLPP